MFNSGMGGILPVMNVDGGNRDGNGWGGDGGWWVLIILFALFGGWGNGWGGNGGQNGGVGAEVQRGFDTSAILTKLDGLSNGICDASYAALSQSNDINTNIMQTGFGLQGAINGLGQQVADCCCTTQRSIDQVRFDNAQNTCAITNAMTQGFAQVDRTINDKFCELEMSRLREQNAEKDAIIAAQNNRISNDAQTQTLINTLRPCPTPTYVTCNPWATNGSCYNGCNSYDGCGCCA